MNRPSLAANEHQMVADVLRRHPEVTAAKIFGSRAKGTHSPRSDVDLAVWGEVDEIRAEAIAAELDELPLPYTFDVKSFACLKHPALRDHIERVGVPLYLRPASG